MYFHIHHLVQGHPKRVTFPFENFNPSSRLGGWIALLKHAALPQERIILSITCGIAAKSLTVSRLTALRYMRKRLRSTSIFIPVSQSQLFQSVLELYMIRRLCCIQWQQRPFCYILRHCMIWKHNTHNMNNVRAAKENNVLTYCSDNCTRAAAPRLPDARHSAFQWTIQAAVPLRVHLRS